jgi:hypothetical protein
MSMLWNVDPDLDETYFSLRESFTCIPLELYQYFVIKIRVWTLLGEFRICYSETNDDFLNIQVQIAALRVRSREMKQKNL